MRGAGSLACEAGLVICGSGGANSYMRTTKHAARTVEAYRYTTLYCVGLWLAVPLHHFIEGVALQRRFACPADKLNHFCFSDLV